jgi:hypothetical protein
MLRRYRFDYVHNVGSLVAALQGGKRKRVSAAYSMAYGANKARETG